MDILGKIRKLQYERDWTDYKFAKESGIQQSSIATMFARKTPPKLEMLQCFCEAFGITLSQFFLEDEKIEILSDREREMLTAFRKLPQKKQQTLIDLIKD